MSERGDSGMIQGFINTEQGIRNINSVEISNLPNDVKRLDLLDPDSEEEKAVESFFRIDVPTEQEIVEIEDSSRFYQRKDNIYVTATILTRLETGCERSSVRHGCQICAHPDNACICSI